MRRMSTVVFPVPAPATTSMGPVTCSMACCCCGSGWMEALGFDFETAIERENIRVANPSLVVRWSSFALSWWVLASGFGERPTTNDQRRLLLQDRSRDSHRRNRRGLRAQNRVAQGRRRPSRIAKRHKFLRLPAAFGAEGQQHGAGIKPNGVFQQKFFFRFRQNDSGACGQGDQIVEFCWP